MKDMRMSLSCRSDAQVVDKRVLSPEGGENRVLILLEKALWSGMDLMPANCAHLSCGSDARAVDKRVLSPEGERIKPRFY